MTKPKVQQSKTPPYVEPITYEWGADPDVDAIDVRILDKDENYRLELRVGLDEHGEGYVTFYDRNVPVTFRLDQFHAFLESAKGRVYPYDEDDWLGAGQATDGETG